MAEAWGGDPGHSGAKPMMSLKGGITGAHTQMPMESDNTGPGRGVAEATSGNIAGWNTTVIGSGMHGGDTPNRGTGLYDKPNDY